MINAAKVLAMTASDFMQDSELIGTARDDWAEARGEDFEYKAMLGDRDPPLDYRK